MAKAQPLNSRLSLKPSLRPPDLIWLLMVLADRPFPSAIVSGDWPSMNFDMTSNSVPRDPGAEGVGPFQQQFLYRFLIRRGQAGEDILGLLDLRQGAAYLQSAEYIFRDLHIAGFPQHLVRLVIRPP